jgi:hypothetical protein
MWSTYYQGVSLLNTSSADSLAAPFVPTDTFENPGALFIVPSGMLSGFGYMGPDLQRQLIETDSWMLPGAMKSLVEVRLFNL